MRVDQVMSMSAVRDRTAPGRIAPGPAAARHLTAVMLLGLLSMVGCDAPSADAAAGRLGDATLADAAEGRVGDAALADVAEGRASTKVGDAAPEPGASGAGVVDSIFPVEEEIRRFQATLPGEVTALSGGETDRDALVARFVRAVEAADTADLARMAMSRAEYGYLYYPTSRYTAPPYRLSPALAWYQNNNVGGRGLTRLLRRYGGQDMGFVSYACPEPAVVEGRNRFWHRCTVRHQVAADTVDIQLFGSIWERDGHYKLVGYANAF
jgi:hypothetical protein